MSSPYAWIIDQDHLTGPGGEFYRPEDDEKGIVGPHNADIPRWRLSDYDQSKACLLANYQHHHQFRMYDDDGELYYTGTLYWNGEADQLTEEQAYGPLGDYGMPNAGAVEIRYTGRKEWDCG